MNSESEAGSQMTPNMTPRRRQRGAALVVGLLLLLILTMLAISTMNSASVEFIMAGNEQYHQNAFQAAESGIAQTIATTQFIPANFLVPQTINGNISATDNYTVTSRTQLNGQGLAPDIWGTFGYQD